MARDVHYWSQYGLAARLAHEAVKGAYGRGVRESDPARYDALLLDFHAATARALPSADPSFVANLAAGHQRAIEEAIGFLEADPWCFRSGYEKQNLIRHLKRAALSEVQRERLGGVVLAAVDGRDRAEFRHYCRLGCAVWSDALDEAVALRMESPDRGIRRRALWVAEAAVASGKA